MNTNESFLAFNGTSLSFVNTNGEWFVAINPICEALGIDYVRQAKNLREDSILSKQLTEQALIAADGKVRKHMCLPERFVYGWLFSIKSDAPGLENYKWTCYNLLFEHFHGTITGRKELIGAKAKVRMEMDSLISKGDKEVLRLVELQQKEKSIANQLRKIDADMLNEQYTLWKDKK